MTVNHDVAGSSPAGGANQEAEYKSTLLLDYVLLSCRLDKFPKETLHGSLARRCERPAGGAKQNPLS